MKDTEVTSTDNVVECFVWTAVIHVCREMYSSMPHVYALNQLLHILEAAHYCIILIPFFIHTCIAMLTCMCTFPLAGLYVYVYRAYC